MGDESELPVVIHLPKSSLQKVGVAALMHESDDVKCIALDLIVDEIRKGPALAAWKSMWADVISALPFAYSSDDFLHPGMEIVAQPFRNFRVARFCV